jgi:hypothetical protein
MVKERRAYKGRRHYFLLIQAGASPIGARGQEFLLKIFEISMLFPIVMAALEAAIHLASLASQ